MVSPGTHFTNDFSIRIQIRWEFHFAVIPLLVNISQQNFAHDTTAQQSYYVRNLIATALVDFVWQGNKISITLSYDGIIVSEMGPGVPIRSCNWEREKRCKRAATTLRKLTNPSLYAGDEDIKTIQIRFVSRFAPSQWETSLQSNAVSGAQT